MSPCPYKGGEGGRCSRGRGRGGEERETPPLAGLSPAYAPPGIPGDISCMLPQGFRGISPACSPRDSGEYLLHMLPQGFQGISLAYEAIFPGEKRIGGKNEILILAKIPRFQAKSARIRGACLQNAPPGKKGRLRGTKYCKNPKKFAGELIN